MNSQRFKNIIKSILLPFYLILNIFYLPFLRSYLFSRIQKVPRSTQLFFMTRFDFGTWLLLMHYAKCWTQERGPTCLVIFTPAAHTAIQLAQSICPQTTIIAFDHLIARILFSIFRRELMQFYTLNPIYAYACCRWPHALFLFDMTFSRKHREHISSYVPFFDPVLQNGWPFSEDFLKAYLRAMYGYDYRRSTYRDMIKLSYQCSINSAKKPSQNSKILNQLGINSPYIVMNLNCKDYKNRLRNNRRIHHPERYNPMIDFLISKNYTVVLQGRDEQPHLAPRKGLVEYFKTPFVSSENDFNLFSECTFAIFPKTGPEVFGPICNVPVLGLNYTELAAIVPKSRCRFFPKHVWDAKQQRFVHWKELLKRPCFFDVGILSFEEGIEYIDLSEEELLNAAIEFLDLLPREISAWKEYSPLQKEFKQAVHPAHIDLYDVEEVPCDAYLASPKYKQ
jgi:putative glycosyltransferase (TIGR04372 family)